MALDTQTGIAPYEAPEKDLYEIGTAAKVLKVIKISKDNFSVVLQGISRIRAGEFQQTDPFLTATVTTIPDSLSTDVELDALVAPAPREFARTHPRAQVSLFDLPPQGQIERLRAGELDAAILANAHCSPILAKKEVPAEVRPGSADLTEFYRNFREVYGHTRQRATADIPTTRRRRSLAGTFGR